MAVTVATQTARLQRIFPEITSAVASEYLGYAHRELCFDMPLYMTDEDITLDGSSQSFAINEDDLRVWSATYHYSATRSKPLRAMTKRKMDLTMSGWRNTPEQVPTMYAVVDDAGTKKVLLYPSPSVATSGGYPKVTLSVSRYVALSTNLPSGLVAPDVYALFAAYKYALDHDMQSRARLLQPELHMAIQKNLQGFDFKVADAPPSSAPAFRFPTTVR